MKILVVSDGYPTDKYKMSGLFQFDQAVALKEEGNQVVFFSINLRSVRKWRRWGIYTVEKRGVVIYNISLPVGAVTQSLFSAIAGAAFEMLYEKAQQDGWRFDIIHAHFWDMGYVCAKHKKEGIPLVVTEHYSGFMSNSLDPRISNMACYTYHMADRVIAVSNQLANVIRKNYNVEAIFVPDVIDNKLFYINSEPHKGMFNICFVGNLIPRKCAGMLIDAFYEAFFRNEEHNAIHLTICGDGVCRNECEEKIKKYALSKQVHLRGMCSRDEIAKELNRSDLFVLPSRAETFGVVYVEALFCGLPVIATKCGGPEEIINETNGVLISVDSKDELIDALQRMYASISHYSKENISKAAQNIYSTQAVAKRIRNAFDSALMRNKEGDRT